MRGRSRAKNRTVWLLTCTFLLLRGLVVVKSANNDRFNYRATVGNDYGPEDWGQVTCDDLDVCLGWPDGWELGKGWQLETNKCRWCPADNPDNNCGDDHWQSPINLNRRVGLPSDSIYNECFDAHWMAYEDGGCDWWDMINNPWAPNRNAFQIRRHALQIIQPVDEKTGLLQCQRKGRKFPRLDYPYGFPDWWHLSHTEITTPSEHSQNGVFYDAEVHLSHFYQYNDGPNLDKDLGKVVIFLKAVNDYPRWPYLDKLICQWREAEDEVRKDCDLPYTAPPYPGCRNGASPAPSPPPKPPFADLFPWIDCQEIDNPKRICKRTSCCQKEANYNDYCSAVYEKYADVIGSICWWCCPGKRVDPAIAPPTLSTTLVPTAPLVPTSLPTMEPTVFPMRLPTGNPTKEFDGKLGPTVRPTKSATPVPTKAPTTISLRQQPLVCGDYHAMIDVGKMCNDACVEPRCATTRCHTFYNLLGGDVSQFCTECCTPSKEVGPPPPMHPHIPWFDCTMIEQMSPTNPLRICKSTSCCNEQKNYNNYCNTQVYSKFNDEELFGICWYCCSEPKLVEGAPPFPAEGDDLVRPSLLPTGKLTEILTLAPTVAPTKDANELQTRGPITLPPTMQPLACSEYHALIDVGKMCNDACVQPRCATTRCHSFYNLLGDYVSQFCSACCTPSKEVGSAPPVHPQIPWFDCTTIEQLSPTNPFRICKPTSCCNEQKNYNNYCNTQVYSRFNDEELFGICWYCCSEPKLVEGAPPFSLGGSDTTRNRHLRAYRRFAMIGANVSLEEPIVVEHRLTRNDGSLLEHAKLNTSLSVNDSGDVDFSPLSQADAGVMIDVGSKVVDPASYIHKIRLSEEDKRPHISEDDFRRELLEYEERRAREAELQLGEDEKAESSGHRRRQLSSFNYEDVPWSDYEWLREVNTEFFFRYEGNQMVPPCYIRAHYRVMKDYIRVNPVQIRELERLLAHYIAPKRDGTNPRECQRDTAGRVRPERNGDAVDLNRPLQSYSTKHKTTFCECKDWDSKLEADLAWCELPIETRLLEKPYNFGL